MICIIGKLFRYMTSVGTRFKKKGQPENSRQLPLKTTKKRLLNKHHFLLCCEISSFDTIDIHTGS